MIQYHHAVIFFLIRKICCRFVYKKGRLCVVEKSVLMLGLSDLDGQTQLISHLIYTDNSDFNRI